MPRSIQGRMLAISAVLTAIALLGRFAVNQVERRLNAEMSLLTNAVDRDGRVDEARLRRNPARFEGWPDWQWRIRTPSRIFTSAGFRDVRDLRSLPPGPQRQQTLTLATTSGPVELIAVQPLEMRQERVERAFALPLDALAILAPLIGVAAILLGLRPLRRFRDDVSRIRDGRAARLSEDQPPELLPLARELNELASANEAALTAARQSAANLAHALKTPVATLALELRDNPVATAQIGRIQTTIRHHLTRARLQSGHRRPSTLLASAVADVVDTVLRLHGGRKLAIETDLPKDVRVALDPQDLAELLGNLIDNAARHAASRVVVRARQEAAGPRWLLLAIADDGCGMSAEERERIGEPGLRLDEDGPGHGFGLAIVRDLARLYGGALRLNEADGGGLLVQVSLPVAHAD